MTAPCSNPSYELPGLLADIAEVTSVATALKFAHAFGGQRLYIPTPERMAADHKIIEVVGADDAYRIARNFAGGSVVIPMGPAADDRQKRARIARLLQDGESQHRVAAQTNTHIRTVERIAAKMRRADNRPDDQQGRLL